MTGWRVELCETPIGRGRGWAAVSQSSTLQVCRYGLGDHLNFYYYYQLFHRRPVRIA